MKADTVPCILAHRLAKLHWLPKQQSYSHINKICVRQGGLAGIALCNVALCDVVQMVFKICLRSDVVE